MSTSPVIPSKENSKLIEEVTENMNLTSIDEPSGENSSSISEPLSIVEPSNEDRNPIVESSTDETSQENTTTLVDNAEENTSVNFSFQLRPARILKQALECLSEEHFNPQGLGMFHVGDDVLDITVRNSETGAMGNLRLNATGLINFECNKVMINRWVNLNHILQNLVDVPDKDAINIYHLDGSNQLLFSFGIDSPIQFSEELLELDAKWETFSNVVYACEGIIPCDDFRLMIQEYEKVPKPTTVSVEMSKMAMNVSVAGGQTWAYRYEPGSKANGVRGLEGQMKHQAWFQWPHCEFLKKASWMTDAFLVCFTFLPFRQIMHRFNLRELGDLVYLNKSDLTIYDVMGPDLTAQPLPLSARDNRSS